MHFFPVFIIISLMFHAHVISAMEEDQQTYQRNNIQYSSVNPATTAMVDSAKRWGKTYLIPGVLIGAGTTLGAVTYFYQGDVSELSTVATGACSFITFFGGCIWYGVTKCAQNIGADIRTLLSPQHSDEV